MHTDHHFIQALRRNDPAGIREIYNRFSAEAARWIANNNGTPEDARDVFQEAVVALYEKARNPDFVLTCPLGALLYVIYSRKWVDRLRAKKRESEVRIQEESRYQLETRDDVLDLAEQALAAERDHQRLTSAFRQLSELCQKMLGMLAEGLSALETAEKLALNSVDTLYRRKNACMKRWRAIFLET